MKGTYTIGVFGRRRTRFIISATANHNSFISLHSGVPLKFQQDQRKISLFKYGGLVGQKEDLNLKVDIDVKRGKVTLYTNCYDPNSDD
mmetsp:Transcript_10901/g.16546  ORF Transcript_10901/g.16546 Transcript_10901/m.16546 type:complete len:88 (-) Transcript_10901:2050-2313(-)